MQEKKIVLITCSRLVDLAGAEITSIELINFFLKNNWRVFFASYEISAEIHETLNLNGVKYFDLDDENSFKNCPQIDIAWMHHNVTANRILLDKSVNINKTIFSSLSHFEALESPPLSNFNISHYLVNSEENLEYFLEKYPEYQKLTKVHHNSAPLEFWENKKTNLPRFIRNIAVISNHIPTEVKEVIRLLLKKNIKTEIFGLDGRHEIINSKIINNFDAIISIGKTVQYCIASQVPIYCYDHFGGDGWLTIESFDRNRKFNFSGRGSRGHVSAEVIQDELLKGYEAACNTVPKLNKLGLEYFSLEKNIINIINSPLPFSHSLYNISKTDGNIIRSQTKIYSSLRKIIKNLHSRDDDFQKTIDSLNASIASLKKNEELNSTLSDKISILTKENNDYAIFIEIQKEEIINLNTEIMENKNRIIIEQKEKIEYIEKFHKEELKNLNELIDKTKSEIHHLLTKNVDYSNQILIYQELIQNKDNEIIELNYHAQKLHAIESSRSWRITSFARNIKTKYIKSTSNIKTQIAWIKFLANRSIHTIEHHGFIYLSKKGYSYSASAIHRYLTSNRIDKKKQEPIDTKKFNILVSFVIPVYDRTDILRAAINSALSQTIENIEIIIVTDGSPKETIDVLNEYAKNPKIKIFNFPKSSGNAVRGRNKGILESRGKYVAFLDSDDIAKPDRLQHCLPLLEKSEADIVYGAWQALIDGSRDIPGIKNNQIIFSPDADLKLLVDVCVPCQSTVIVRRSLFDTAGLLKPRMKYREDHELWVRLAYFGGIFKSVSNVCTQLRLHNGNNELNFQDNSDQWKDLVINEYKTPGPKPKKIAFILPGVGISGGIAVVFKHAELLMASGHDAFVINIGEIGTGDWFTNNPVPIIHISDQRKYQFQKIDLLFATGWSTAEWLDKFKAERKLYFVQSDERRFYDEIALKNKIHDTYLTSCEYLTEALWIKKMLHDEFGHEAAYVPNGLDENKFFPDKPYKQKQPGKLRVLLEGPIIIPFKGMQDSYAAIKDLDCEIWIISSAGAPPSDWRYNEFFEGVPFGDMRHIYSSCDIFLKMSRIEGFFGPPLEAMACGCAVVVGKVTGYDEYIVNDHNALVVDQGDVLAAKNSVEKLLKDENLRNNLIKEGHATVKNWNWDTSAKAMLDLVNK